ncbi:hypothetical protein EDD18DRAFT_1114347 [Armillaria luteobubalina]|uniref:Uncharacterized protein n=1 Tax=Armillaria luteobubalina TaxID=153913 RepID=A0AA39P6H9_9AGAR|nr:hypothetical protein EDD18DRAFT_1114347 [Armillaria luteobubalina]
MNEDNIVRGMASLNAKFWTENGGIRGRDRLCGGTSPALYTAVSGRAVTDRVWVIGGEEQGLDADENTSTGGKIEDSGSLLWVLLCILVDVRVVWIVLWKMQNVMMMKGEIGMQWGFQ